MEANARMTIDVAGRRVGRAGELVEDSVAWSGSVAPLALKGAGPRILGFRESASSSTSGGVVPLGPRHFDGAGGMAHVIVLGNEKGGSGKSTTAMHLITALARAGHRVGVIDLDLRQASLFRYLDNRADYMRRHSIPLPMPRRFRLELSQLDSKAEAEAEEQARFDLAIGELSRDCDSSTARARTPATPAWRT
jgi:hypothetical protein